MSVRVGDRATLRHTLTERTVELYCALTGDLDPLHVDEAFARTTPYGRRIAPGGLVIGLMLAAASRATGHHDVAVPSLGFDRIRQVAPVFLGETVDVAYEVTALAGRRGTAHVLVSGEAGQTVAVAEHVFTVLD